MFGSKKKSPQPEAADDAAVAAGDAAAAESSSESPETSDSSAPAAPVNPAEAKKSGPTPKRNAQVAARKQPLVPDDRREANRKARAEQRAERDKSRIGVMNGDERYLTMRDRGPQRRFVRDFVDARLSISEFFIPVALIVLIVGMFGGPQIQLIANVVVYGVMALVILDCFVMSFRLRGALAAKFGGKDRVEKGLTFYSVMRSIQIRALRIPKPQVKRGERPS